VVVLITVVLVECKLTEEYSGGTSNHEEEFEGTQ